MLIDRSPPGRSDGANNVRTAPGSARGARPNSVRGARTPSGQIDHDRPTTRAGKRRNIMARRSHLMVLPAALFGVLAAVASARETYPVCPAKAFTIHPGAPGSPIAAGTQLIVADGQVTLGTGCPAAHTRVRGTKRGTRVVARWTSCPGMGRMRIKGMIDQTTCGTFTGSVVVSDPPWKDVVVATAANGGAADAVRIGTYNVQFLSGLFGREGSPCAIGKGDNDDVDRPPVIAERVKASGYDIIAFNEVFDATAQEQMVKAMTGTYHYYVEKLDLDPLNQEDSGLQIFSRWPFVKFDAGSNAPTKSGNCWASNCEMVAVRDYSECDGDDCYASKGVAMVRIQNPHTGRIYNVAFTHMQAFYARPESFAS